MHSPCKQRLTIHSLNKMDAPGSDECHDDDDDDDDDGRIALSGDVSGSVVGLLMGRFPDSLMSLLLSLG